MSVPVSDEILHVTHMREEELLQEIALLLYQKERLTLTQANRLVRTRRFAILAVTPHR